MKMIFLLIIAFGALYADYSRDDTVGILTDNDTGLMWQDTAAAVTEKMHWQVAIDRCEALVLGGYDDWRLPDLNVLRSIVNRDRSNSAIDPLFQNVVSSYYWTSTSVASTLGSAWTVHFSLGGNYRDDKDIAHYYRCVRGGSGSYSDLSLQGAWIEKPSNYTRVYMITDGAGVISEFGAFNMPSPAGTYEVTPEGEITLTVNTRTIHGEMLSDLEFTGTFPDQSGDYTATFAKVTDLAACAGTWNVTIESVLNDETDQPPVDSFTVTVNSNGEITDLTGFASPVSGKFFCEGNNMVAHLSTGESDDSQYEEMTLFGTLSSGTVNGYANIDNGSNGDNDLRLTLTKEGDVISLEALIVGRTFYQHWSDGSSDWVDSVTFHEDGTSEVVGRDHNYYGTYRIDGDTVYTRSEGSETEDEHRLVERTDSYFKTYEVSDGSYTYSYFNRSDAEASPAKVSDDDS